ncbi:MAG: hypothetical protein COT89_02290 [Candidatus Colwellbacteria bacterium CG10_big_fil_rev_8_21_14_0_10_42_22]|uniref:Uncharacterized protein n=1 Tax=Candidatus Colwellbacteria bacterium CG10_big_fil_rev_8_21_14_0_10_42_22 TaxID=1974540 RepID=A0A2H0VFK8_9BACT|nr:MAG: hypothetical protein COT89_02290 [Candidatus Colwellbacteria bacterium CG10_big_fil_rev_8_21_14_0_10_42_22]
MFDFLSPIDALSSVTLLFLAVFGLIELLIILRHRYYLEKKHLAILRLDPQIQEGKIGEFIKSIRPPFIFEVAVHQLGKEIHYYLILPRKRVKHFKNLSQIKRVEDYHLFHHGGEHLGAYLKGDDKWPDIDFKKIDFSKVNEVGEGVAIQLVFGRRRMKKTAVNFRILISAPSSYQAKEILSAIKPAFSNLSLIESKSEEFLRKANFREFNEKEAMYWMVAGNKNKA